MTHAGDERSWSNSSSLRTVRCMRIASKTSYRSDRLEEAMYRNDFRVGDEFYYHVMTDQGLKTLSVKVVGAFQPMDDDESAIGIKDLKA